jgi:hypothetical protein
MKRPTKAEYVATVDDAGIHVIHRPTESYYDYYLLADGGLSLPPLVQHAKTGDTGDYVSSEVRAMADEVAQTSLRSREQRS